MAALAGRDKAVQCAVRFVSGWGGRGEWKAHFFPFGNLMLCSFVIALVLQALSVTETLIKPLEKFRKEQLGAVKVGV